MVGAELHHLLVEVARWAVRACVGVVDAPSATVEEVLAVLDVAEWAAFSHRPVAAVAVAAAAGVGSAPGDDGDGDGGVDGDGRGNGVGNGNRGTADAATSAALLAAITTRLVRLPPGGRRPWITASGQVVALATATVDVVDAAAAEALFRALGLSALPP